ncbi:E3 ubiquitin-protein ligase PUB24-like [Mangifera indica]|uniref:E3 ubiquitin-protein ligase PUB24-like n=1 Tax=Mangifera indica TaxID=29780 RepID=UPI001CF941FE|nr:E3 ubiquitin-protein ligase PUB24-like [Mangifera indica]
MEDIEVPEYFTCPISLQIMKDPVTAITGITYDRESIEHWLFKGKNSTCPVTQQPLPPDSDLTPNHTLRRLIQAWCIENAAFGVDRVPTPKTPLNKFHIIKLIKDLWRPQLDQIQTLRKLEVLAAENERNRKYMTEVGLPKAILEFLVTCFERKSLAGLEEALSILHFFGVPSGETKLVQVEIEKIIEALTWVLGQEMENDFAVKSHAMIVLKSIVSTASSTILERLKPGLFQKIISVLRVGINKQGINAALHVLLDACPWGRNRVLMVQSGAVFELIELELSAPERRITELVLGILYHLCCCADGREQFLNHKGGVAVVTKRILRVSPASDDRGILILSLITKFSGGNNSVLQEMLKVGAVMKLCKVLLADSAVYLKNKAREILKSHYEEWKDSPCVNSSLISEFII